MKRSRAFIRACYWAGALADLIATAPLVSPRAASFMFGVDPSAATDAYFYVARVGASLMLGWTFLLAWGARRPIERRGVLLITVFPVLAGIITAGILAVASGFVMPERMIPTWIFQALITPAYIIAWVMAGRIAAQGGRDE
ncbi:MAG: hypothetical protein EPN93_09440 [Spirochaetes bacterium]|nr:MAG: hypothetical protein EPN93_09440 [Spirochaetota bacterium]